MRFTKSCIIVFLFLSIVIYKFSLAQPSPDLPYKTNGIRFALPLPTFRGAGIQEAPCSSLCSIGTRLPDGRLKHIAAGYIIRPGWILTAAHSVVNLPDASIIVFLGTSDPNNFKVLCIEDAYLPVDSISANGSNDIALLKFEATGIRLNELNAASASRGNITLWGWDGAKGSLQACEIQMATEEQEDSFLFFELPPNLEIGAGNSGAPLFMTDSDGRHSLHGILIAGERKATSLFPHRLIALRLEPFLDDILRVIDGQESDIFVRR